MSDDKGCVAIIFIVLALAVFAYLFWSVGDSYQHDLSCQAAGGITVSYNGCVKRDSFIHIPGY